MLAFCYVLFAWWVQLCSILFAVSVLICQCRIHVFVAFVAVGQRVGGAVGVIVGGVVSVVVVSIVVVSVVSVVCCSFEFEFGSGCSCGGSFANPH